MQTAPETDPGSDKSRLLALGLDRQIVDKLTSEEAKLVLQNIMYMMERNPKRDTPFYKKLDASQFSSVAWDVVIKLDSVASKIDHRPVTAAAAQAVNIAAASAAKCRPVLKRALHFTWEKIAQPAVSEWTRKGEALAAQGKYTDALECFDRAVEANPSDGNAWNGRGDVLFRLGRFFESANCYARFLHFHPSNVHAWNNKGACMFNMAIYNGAIECFERALALDAASAQAWYGKACATIKAGRPEESLQCLAKAIESGGEEYRKAARNNHAFSALRANERFSKLVSTPLETAQGSKNNIS